MLLYCMDDTHTQTTREVWTYVDKIVFPYKIQLLLHIAYSFYNKLNSIISRKKKKNCSITFHLHKNTRAQFS